jgi:hypothetical protein
MVAMGYWLDGEAHIMMMLMVIIRIKNYRLDQMKVIMYLIVYVCVMNVYLSLKSFPCVIF